MAKKSKKAGPSLKEVAKASKNSALSFSASRRPVTADTIRRNLEGKTLKQLTGNFPPLFPKKPNDGDGKLVFWTGSRQIERARKKKGESDTWTMNTYDVLDEKKPHKILYSAQMPIPTALVDYFEGKKPEDVDCAILIEFGGQMEATGENRAGFKNWIAYEVSGITKDDYYE